MQIGIPQISISDRVNAVKPDPSITDTSSIPTVVNTSPGDTSNRPIDARPMNKSGADVKSQSQTANKGTSDSLRKGPLKEAGAIQYENRKVSPEDQAPSPNRAEDISQTPPKSRGFQESLLDKQVSARLTQNTGGDRGAQNKDFGHDNGDPNSSIKKAPEGKPQRRDQIQPLQSNPKIQDRGEYPNSINTEGVMKRTTTPNIKIPKPGMPNIRMKF